MSIRKGMQAWIVVSLLWVCSTAWGQGFRIASQPNDGWPIDVQGSATMERQSNGVLIRLDTLTVTARYPVGDPLYIAALRFNGSDTTGIDKGTDRRTSLMFSERVPVGQSLAPGAVLRLQISTPIFMRNPDWHQTDPRFDLAVEIRDEGREGWIPIATTLHTLKLPSDFRRNSKSEVRDSSTPFPTTTYGALLVTALLAYWAFARWCRAPSKEAIIGLMVMVFVWIGGLYPLLVSGYSLLWTHTPAQIVDTAVREIPPSGKQTRFQYTPVVKYQYTVAGQRFTSTQLRHASQAWYPSRDEAWARLQAWDALRLAERPVDAWVNPQNPSDAVLVREPGLLSALLSLLGVIVVFMLWRGKRQRDA